MQKALIKPLDKGQITIPASFRQSLNITKDTLLQAELKDDGLMLKPIDLDWKNKYIREFSDEEIKTWLKEDKLDKKTLKKIKKYLK